MTKDYRPEYLAIDEFAVHKGHRYATCVMDLAEGDILWVGRGRSKTDSARFFEEIDPDYLSEVKAVAMDMNASYNILVERHLPGRGKEGDSSVLHTQELQMDIALKRGQPSLRRRRRA